MGIKRSGAEIRAFQKAFVAQPSRSRRLPLNATGRSGAGDKL
jgi:hypothetical protein